MSATLAFLQSEAAASGDSISGGDWIGAAIALVAGFILGAIASRIVQGFLSRPKSPEAIRAVAKAISSLVFAIFVIVGLITALGFIKPDNLDTLLDDFVNYIPRALSAAIVLIGANVVSELLGAVVERSLGQASASMRARVPMVLRATILGFAGLIAASQLGVDTTILTIAAASLFFGVALAAALMVGLGSRSVASELAAGRALRRMVKPGDIVSVGPVQGSVVDLHSTAIEIALDAGPPVMVPNSKVIESTIALTRSEQPADEDDA